MTSYPHSTYPPSDRDRASRRPPTFDIAQVPNDFGAYAGAVGYCQKSSSILQDEKSDLESVILEKDDLIKKLQREVIELDREVTTVQGGITEFASLRSECEKGWMTGSARIRPPPSDSAFTDSRLTATKGDRQPTVVTDSELSDGQVSPRLTKIEDAA